MLVLTIVLYCFGVAKATLSGQFAVVTTVQLGDAAVADAALQLHSTLDVTYLNSNDENPLLNFQLSSVEARGRGAGASAEFTWRGAERGGGPFAARLAAGALVELRLDPADPPHLQDYKRALVSLFQFQRGAGERNETDVSGDCVVLYEAPADDVIRKIKRSCTWEGATASSVRCRRVTRVTLPGGVLDAVHADEVCAAAGGGGLRARSLLALRRVAPPPAPPAAARAPPSALQAAAVALSPRQETEEDEPALRSVAAAWTASPPAQQPALSLDLYRALRRANASTVADLLAPAPAAADMEAWPLWRWAGAAASQATHAAARGALAGADAAPAQAMAYLQGLAVAPDPHEDVILDVLKLGDKLSPALAGAARLAAAAAASRAAASNARAAVGATLRRSLDNCKTEDCRVLQLHALKNLGVKDDELALREAETSDERAALAALRLITGSDVETRNRLVIIAGSASRPLTVRATAVRLAVRGAVRALPVRWLELARALRALAAAPGELRRVYWGAVAAAGREGELRGMLQGDLNTWDLRANAGTSSVLERVAWRDLAPGWHASLLSTQIAAGGVLRAGDVELWTRGPGSGGDHHVLGVHVWTRGLHAWAGGGGGAGGSQAGGELDDSEEAAAGLQLSVAGTLLPPITLFSSQAELLSLVWGGAGSDATPVLRSAVVLPGAGGPGERVPLAAGSWLRSEGDAAALLELDGQAQVSLWGRTARALLSLRASLVSRVSLRTSTPWGQLRAAAATRARPQLDIAADLDFYTDVALCVRAATHTHEQLRAVHTAARVGSAGGETRRRHEARGAREGRTLALGRPNDLLCRA